ncbi:RadC family protein [Parvibium lacunae]|uniref:JAB domain-containing protein n=1 Tax=Parvibium lacunae TaxID=1888893 RepID=A0A368L459_9BURK|nr:DNA repair protein RadC [Parvibium lacunae]RCS58368.1 JAB domain-containing protein [Parvibium lacunae]
MAIKDWPADERPREKLIQHGAQALSDAELLAVFLRVGVKGQSAVELARTCLQQYGSLQGLFAADLQSLGQIHGMGSAKYAQLQAVLEMAKRALAETLRSTPILGSPQQVRDYLRLHLGHAPREVFVGLFLDSSNRLIALQELAHGTLNEATVYPREVAKYALQHHAAAVIFAHNHPGGQLQASRADIQLTQTLRDALGLLDIRVLDHFIITRHGTLSLAENGQL